MAKIQAENESAKEEVKEVLQALEELAVNYDQKSQEAETKSREYNTISDELSQQQFKLNSAQSELGSVREAQANQRKRTSEMLRSLLTDLGEVGMVIAKNQDLKKPEPNNEGKVEEEFTVELESPPQIFPVPYEVSLYSPHTQFPLTVCYWS